MTTSQAIVVLWVQFVVGATGLFWLARRALARLQQPAERLRLVELALAGAAVLPAFLWVAPWKACRLEILPSAAESSLERTALAPTVAVAGVAPGTEAAGPVGIARPGLAATRGSVENSSAAGTVTGTLVIADGAPRKRGEMSAAAAPVAARSGGWSQMLWRVTAIGIGIAHGLALLAFLVLRGIGWRQWRQLCRRAVPMSDELSRVWHSVTGGRGQAVRLLVSAEIDAPLHCGWLQPVILVPRALVEAGGTSLRGCLAHEWSHVVRGDYLIWRAVDTCQVVFGMLPGYWVLRNELRLCQDMLADHLAAGAGDVVEYSALLVSLARQRLFAPLAGALTFIDKPSQLTRRVKMLLDRSRGFRSRTSWRFSLCAATVTGCAALLVSAVQIDVTRAEPAQAADQKPEKDADEAAPPKAASKVQVEAVKYTCSVVDKETGKGLAGANVVLRRSLYSAGRNQVLAETKHVTDAEGQYEVEIPAEQAAEPYLYIELDVEHPDYASRKGFGYSFGMIRKNEKLGERPFFEKTELHPGEAVTGTILDPQGRPLADAKVQGFSMQAGNDFQTISWTDTLTDAAGNFRLIFHKGGDGVLWVLPKSYGGLEKFVAKQRGNLGQIKVTDGVRVSGQVTGVDQKPITGVPVNLSYSGQREVSLPVSTSVGRGAVTDAEGRFAFDPVPAGEYRLQVDEHSHDPLTKDRQIYKLPAVFLPKTLSLKAESKPAVVEMQAVPHVVIHAQYLNSEGKKTSGHEFFLHGQIDGQFWNGQGRPDKDGTIELRVPHGLEQAQMQLMTNEHGSLRYRRGPGESLQDNTYSIQLGTLNDDMEGFEIIRHKAPIVLVSAVDPAGQPIKKLKLAAKYAKPRPQQYISFENGSDFRFEAQDNGVYRSSRMLPDEEVTLEISAEGFGTVTEKFNLPEGETRELKVALPQAAAEDAAKVE